MVDMGCWDELTWCLNFEWRWFIFAWEEQQFANLKSLIQKVIIYFDKPNSLVWKYGKISHYYVNSFSLQISKASLVWCMISIHQKEFGNVLPHREQSCYCGLCFRKDSTQKRDYAHLTLSTRRSLYACFARRKLKAYTIYFFSCQKS